MRQKYLSTEKQNQHLDFLIDPCFEGVNRISVSSFEIKAIEKYTQDIIFQKYKWKITTLWLMEKTFLISQLKVIQDLQNRNRSKRWLHKWLFARLEYSNTIIRYSNRLQ